MTTLPADAHVHSEWSWDYGSDPALLGSMDRICERAVRIGLPAVVFTEHLDFADDWQVGRGEIRLQKAQSEQLLMGTPVIRFHTDGPNP